MSNRTAKTRTKTKTRANTRAEKKKKRRLGRLEVMTKTTSPR